MRMIHGNYRTNAGRIEVGGLDVALAFAEGVGPVVRIKAGATPERLAKVALEAIYAPRL